MDILASFSPFRVAPSFGINIDLVVPSGEYFFLHRYFISRPVLSILQTELFLESCPSLG